MASPNSNYDNLLTSTLEYRAKTLADNVTDNNALWRRLKERNKIKPISGGSKIVEPLEYGAGDAVWYNGYDTITYTEKQLFTAAEYNMKLCAVPVGISGEDLLKNSGKEQVFDLFTAKIENAAKTMENVFAAAVYGDGTGSNGKEIGGLRLLVADTPTTGTVGGINRATAGNAFWRNQSSTVAAATFDSDPYKAMNSMYLACSRNTDKPDLIVTDDTMYAAYENSLQAQQRFSDAKLANAGFTTLKFKGADVIYDGGHGGHCPANHMYFLNTNYLYLRPHRDRNMKVIGGERMAINQDAIYKILGWAGNMTMSNASVQGVLIRNPGD